MKIINTLNINLIKLTPMETTNLNNMKETIAETFEINNKRFSDLTSAASEAYKNQMNESLNFTGKMMSSFLETNKRVWDSAEHFTSLFSSNNNWMKAMFTPFNNEGTHDNFASSFNSLYAKTMNQIMDYNKNISDAFLKQSSKASDDWKEIKEKYQKNMEKRFESSKKDALTILEAYNKRAELSMETMREVQEDIFEQCKKLTELNQKAWSDVLSKDFSFKNGEAKSFGETTLNSIKKPTKSAVTA
jgi:hypothetical protein